MSIEAMKQALEALEEIYRTGDTQAFDLCYAPNVIQALRQAIEFEEMVQKGTKAWADTPDDWVDDLRGGAEKQKPVAWREIMGKWKTHYYDYNEDGRGEPLYAAPVHASDISQERVDETAKRKHKWVGLTDEAIWLEYQHLWPFHPAEEPTLAKDIAKFARAIEAKLKEKNT